jgi:GTP-binding protein EngB required for normal cell division
MSVFTTPVRISNRLAEFLGKPKDTCMARTEVSKEINNYIKKNNLQDSTNGRKIKPDFKLTSLLNLTPSDELTYFTLQKYLKPHFIESIPKELSTARNELDSEIYEWERRNGENVKPQIRKNFATHLSQKYLANNLDKLQKTEIVSHVRKQIANIIDDFENACYNSDDYDSDDYNLENDKPLKLSNNINLKIQEIEEHSLEHSEEEEKDKVIIPQDNINLCFVGGVSTGKSTVLNGIFCEELTQCKIKRTTMWPTVYIENKSNHDLPTEEIFRIISEKNKEIIEKTESGQKFTKKDYKELVFNVGKLDINILENSYVNVYDIPGLNDARTKDIYYDYLETNFHKFNLVVFLVDIHSGLNTSDEMDMLRFITNNTRDQFKTNSRNIYTLVIVNKADDMQTDEDSDRLEITGELREMFEQVETTVTKEFTSKGLKDNLIGIIPLCAIDAYLYRMVKKHGRNFKLTQEQILKIGVNQNGKKFSTLKPATQEARVYDILNDQEFINTMIKLSGFSRLESILHQFLKDNDKGSKLRIDNLLYELKQLPKLRDITNKKGWFELETFEKLILQYKKIYDNIKLIDTAEYNSIMTSFVSEIETILKEKVSTWLGSINILIDEYNNFVTKILNPYFRDYYNVSEYPKFLTTQVFVLINRELNNISTINSIIQQLHILIRINMFDKPNIEIIFNKIITNVRGKKTIIFGVQDNSNIDDLLNLLDQCNKKDVELSEILRFLVINQMNCVDKDLIFIKKMLYRKHGEIIISEYILCEFENTIIPTNLNSFIRGLKTEDLSNLDNKLDMYYLNYEKEYNSINFINN